MRYLKRSFRKGENYAFLYNFSYGYKTPHGTILPTESSIDSERCYYFVKERADDG